MQLKIRLVKMSIFMMMASFSFYSCTNSRSEGTKDALNFSDMDSTIKPSQDFYHYVNGGWLKNNPIPPEESAWGAFSEVAKRRYKILREILDSAAADTKAEKGSNRQKVGDFYYSGMDSVSLDKNGVKPLADELKNIDEVKDINSLMDEIAHLQAIGVGPLYGVSVDQDLKISTKEVTYITQGGIGMPERDFYFRPDPKSEEIRNEYKKYVANVLVSLGDAPDAAKIKADKIFTLEKALAAASLTNIQLRDPYASYHKMTVAELNKLTPAIDWKKQFSLLGINEDTVIVGQPDFFKEADKQLKSVSINDWKDYLRWNLIDASAPYLDDSTAQKSFYFHATVLNGVKVMKPRWKRVLNTVDGNIGEALGEEYVKKAFSPEAKDRMNKMIDNMVATYRERIKAADWMSDSTKAKAYTKLDKLNRKVGYPDKWRDYTALQIDRSSYIKNVMNSRAFEFKRNVNRLGKPVDHTEWGMTPPTVNAYYNPNLNEIVFPAGILQPPFFNPNADDALNYGGIGAVICHELTHGFDDQGCQYDANGNLVNWWSAADKKNFDERKQKVINQFNAYTVLDTLHVNGRLNIGENIADLGGIMISYAAFKKTDEGKSDKKIDGLTPDQRFFISWATVWRTNMRDEAMRQQVLTNPHAPGTIRGYAPLTNMPEFYAAFNVKPGDPMWRPDSTRAKIW